MRVLVYGAGAVGRWAAHLLNCEALAARAAPDLAGRVVDGVVVAVRSAATAEAAVALARLPGQPHVLCLQNGIGNEAILAARLGSERIQAGALTLPIHRDGRAAASSGGLGIAPHGPAAAAWAAAFALAGVRVRIYPNADALKWSKLLLNLLGNGVPAALGRSTADVYADGRAFALEAAVLREAVGTMRRRGLRPVNLPGFPTRLLAAATCLPDGLLRALLAGPVARGRGDKPASLAADLAARRPLEADALFGSIQGPTAELVALALRARATGAQGAAVRASALTPALGTGPDSSADTRPD